VSYIHGTSPDEQRRLVLMNDLINTGSLRELALEAGVHVLDLGSGTGQLARSMARAAGPSGRVVGVEFSREQLTSARRLAGLADEAEIVDFREGDAAAPPLRDDEWGTFDVVHTRFLLEHLPDPSSVVRTMVRAARPGGRIILEDDDHDLLRLWPEPAGIAAVWSAYQDIYRNNGCDPLIGRKLPRLLHDAGALTSRSTWVFFGACAGNEAFGSAVANLHAILIGARDAILATGAVGAAAFDRSLEALSGWESMPGASFGYAIAWAEGRKPA
jgi:ubiquinone/menaquinone biosynthesis C-methylase UbiE